MTLRSWYKGPTLIEALNSFDPPLQQQEKLLGKPLRIIVTDVLEGSGSGVAVRAKVAQGWVKQGESLVVLPVGLSSVTGQLGWTGVFPTFTILERPGKNTPVCLLSLRPGLPPNRSLLVSPGGSMLPCGSGWITCRNYSYCCLCRILISV